MRFIETLRKENVSGVPFWFMRQAGRYLPEYMEIRKGQSNFLDLCYNPKLAKEVTLQPIERFDMDAAILFSDILVVPDALGVDVQFVKGEGPLLGEFKLDSLEFKIDKLSPVFDAVGDIRGELDSSKALIGFAGAPWTICCYMFDKKGVKEFPETRKAIYQDFEYFISIMDLITNSTIEYLYAQIEAGVNAVQIFDSWAGIVPFNLFDRLILEPAQKITAAIKEKYPHIPVIYFPRGVGEKYSYFAKNVGADAISVDQMTDLSWVDSNSDCVLQGNLDPVLLCYDKQKAVDETRRILDMFAGENFIFNLGHGILKETPVENVEAVCKVIKSYG